MEANVKETANDSLFYITRREWARERGMACWLTQCIWKSHFNHTSANVNWIFIPLHQILSRFLWHVFCCVSCFLHSLTFWWISFIFIFQMVFSVHFFRCSRYFIHSRCEFMSICLFSSKFVSFVQSSVTTRDTHTHTRFTWFFVLRYFNVFVPCMCVRILRCIPFFSRSLFHHCFLSISFFFFHFFLSRCCYFVSWWDLVAIQNERKATVITWHNIDRTCQSKGIAWLC